MWAKAGGMEVLVRTMKSAITNNKDTGYSSDIWSDLSISLFGEEKKKNRHWLWVIWNENRNGLRDLVCKEQENSSESKETGVNQDHMMS